MAVNNSHQVNDGVKSPKSITYEVNRIEYFNMIQGIVTRMASNSFAIKNWCIAITSGMLGITTWKFEDWRAYLLILIPILMFWYLDSYYLQQERLFRGVYDRVRLMSDEQLKNSNYSLIPPRKGDPDYKKSYKMINVFFSKTELVLYGNLMLIATIIILVIYFTK